jgi:hypothetical protein
MRRVGNPEIAVSTQWPHCLLAIERVVRMHKSRRSAWCRKTELSDDADSENRPSWAETANGSLVLSSDRNDG